MLHRPHTRRKAAAGALAVLLGALALAGCSANRSGTSGAPDNAAAPAAGAPNQYSGGDAAGGKAADAPAPTSGDAGTLAPVQERSLIYTGTITVEVDSVAQRADAATAIALGAGGLVAGDNRTIDAGRSQATLILRVPANQFESTLDALSRLGTEESRQISADDVTEQMIDLDVRIAAQKASVNRVQALLAQAQSISEIMSIESELTRRQADLDSLTQRRAKMAGLVDLATVTAVLHGPDATIATPKEEQTGFLAGLRAGWHGFLASVAGVLTVAGYLLPWVVAIGVPLWLILWLTRRRRRARLTPPPPAPAASAPPTPATGE
jgi:hypothetical protein